MFLKPKGSVFGAIAQDSVSTIRIERSLAEKTGTTAHIERRIQEVLSNQSQGTRQSTPFAGAPAQPKSGENK